MVKGPYTKSYVINVGTLVFHTSTETSSDSVTTDTTVEVRMARDDIAGSRSYSLASMNGPVPMGSAASRTAAVAHMGGMSNTQRTRAKATRGCSTSFIRTMRLTSLVLPDGWSWARNSPMVTRAQGLAAALSRPVNWNTKGGSGIWLAATAAPATGAMTSGFFSRDMPTLAVVRRRFPLPLRSISISTM